LGKAGKTIPLMKRTRKTAKRGSQKWRREASRRAVPMEEKNRGGLKGRGGRENTILCLRNLIEAEEENEVVQKEELHIGQKLYDTTGKAGGLRGVTKYGRKTQVNRKTQDNHIERGGGDSKYNYSRGSSEIVERLSEKKEVGEGLQKVTP